jgi:death-on-curing protein
LTAWLERRDVDLHYDELIVRYGSLVGLPNEGVLAATLARPQQLLAYGPGSTQFDLAAAYGFGFARNHCFPDGNKRMALSSMDVFLMLNGQDLVPDEAEAVVIVNAVAAGEFSQDELAEWLEHNSKALAKGKI